jgi:hypothetical protein
MKNLIQDKIYVQNRMILPLPVQENIFISIFQLAKIIIL